MEYYKVNLDGSFFWQSNPEKRTFSQKFFQLKDSEELNNIYLEKMNENTFKELYTGKKILVDFKESKHKFVSPRGVYINLEGLSKCDKSDILTEFKKIKEKKLTYKYIKILTDLCINSELCERAKERKKLKIS